MDGPAMLADHLETQADSIIGIWRSTIERDGDVPESEGLSDREFIDHIPELLDRLSGRLRGRSVDVTREGQKYGRIRWRQGYDIGELVNELGHLRSALCRATFDYAREQDFDFD